MHTMTDYTESLIIGHNILQSDCSMNAMSSLQSPKFFFCRCCHVMSVKHRCSVAEDARAHSLLGVADR